MSLLSCHVVNFLAPHLQADGTCPPLFPIANGHHHLHTVIAVHHRHNTTLVHHAIARPLRDDEAHLHQEATGAPHGQIGVQMMDTIAGDRGRGLEATATVVAGAPVVGVGAIRAAGVHPEDTGEERVPHLYHPAEVEVGTVGDEGEARATVHTGVVQGAEAGTGIEAGAEIVMGGADKGCTRGVSVTVTWSMG